MECGVSKLIINWPEKQIRTKIVYFGPAMSGKTTSIKYLFTQYASLEQLESIETTTGRTLFFDFGCLPLKLGEWDIHVHIWSATGQDYYAGTRNTVLTGVDGIMFIADPQPTLIQDNIRSWAELRQYLDKNTGENIPVTICVNKSDIKERLATEKLMEELGLPADTMVFQTIATQGMNVTEAFKNLLRRIFNGHG
ncbi:MAG: GTP-binding protein [Candidatus Ranarchaeia archaeon]